jgi:phage terminase large subunit GpA-like protein
VDYNTYIHSNAWRVFRLAALRRQPCCQACGRRDRLNVHHVTYENLGHESPEDVLVLCHSCHEYHHARGVSLVVLSLPRTAPSIRTQHMVTQAEWEARKVP